MSEAADEIVAIAEEIAASRNVRTEPRGANPLLPKRSPALDCQRERRSLFVRHNQRCTEYNVTYYIKIENADDEKHVTDVKLTIHSIEPQNEYVGPGR